ncbi:glycosyltransferase family 2 protein [Methylobacter sp. YRD-M1]|uniref:glycosyltransferase family 2 protein n=1 Tax=Methylobacter sp. YRD-M1 TaxID=2911520 RepID=UPI00227AC537|nr:glycosyltransferase family 2 protein [Methylobacter sp. YRD-M1]WAK02047.1 glycosyltransferase family 2 protein [Methylobacter sp. YRD-M1]
MNKQLDAVTLVTVNYNAGDMLLSCIRSAVGQAGEIIVVDNASSDQSLANLSVQDELLATVKIIRNSRNLGFAAACNIGMQAAKGDYILFLNPDCELNPDAIQAMLDVFHECAEAGMAGGLLVDPDGKEQGGGRRAIPTPWRSFVRAFGLSRFEHRWPRLFSDFHLNKQPLPVHPVEIEAISGACMLVKRKAVEDVGLWDEAYFLHCEDLDWCMRFRQKKWKILFVPDAHIIHYKGMCSRSRPIFVEWHKHKGMMRFYRKFFRHQYPGPLMWLVGAGIGLRFGMLVVYFTSCHIAHRLRLLNG